MSAPHALDRFRGGEPPRPWLVTIVANAARTRRTAVARRPTLTLDPTTAYPTDEAAQSPEAVALVAKQRRELLDAVNSLRRDDQPGIAYRYFLDLSEAETAALLTQFQREADSGLIEKGLPVPASGRNQSHLEAVSVGGESGFWISGAPHGIFFVCYDVGECRQERYRLAGDVLLWEQDGLTLRLESTLSRDEALAIAESVRAVE